MSIKYSKETIGNRTRDLPAYSAMPQLTASTRALQLMDVCKTTTDPTDRLMRRGERRNVNNTGIVCNFRRAMKRTCALCNPVLIEDTLTIYYTVYCIVVEAVNCVLSETRLRDLEATIQAEYKWAKMEIRRKQSHLPWHSALDYIGYNESLHCSHGYGLRTT
jgi:hypothetical protein